MVQVFVNGRQMTEMDDQSSAGPLGDVVALQLHAGPPMQGEFKGLVLDHPPPAPPVVQRRATGPWRDVALASEGGRALASDTFGNSGADQLIEGIADKGAGRRWHSEQSKPRPHWVEIQLDC